MTPAKKILFVVMPWHTLHLPSLATGILTSIVHKYSSERRYSVETFYANLHWAEYLEKKTGGVVTPDKYALLGEDLFFQVTGEWVFSPALYGTPEWRVEEYRSAFLGSSEQFELALAAHRVSGEFVDMIADQIIAKGCDIVGLTSVFQQNLACLALAKRLKAKAPHIVIIMGGANCDGVQGKTLHRNFDFLDFVFSGESDYAFKQFLSFLDGELSIQQVNGVTWRDSKGQSISNPPGPLPKASDFAVPDHDDYFAQASSSPVNRYIKPTIVAESARGCWWGQKRHCSFCGLNGMGMAFRSKDPNAFLVELEHLIRRYRSLDITLADNILDMKYLSTVLPAIKARGWDVRIHYEIKANFKREQLEMLRDAGVWHVQPGIESLSTKVLRLMEKGTTGPQNIKLLRECEELNLTASWNMLAGFPGETEQDYRHIERQIPALVHLQPPGGATRIILERFSPFFNDPKLGFAERRPSSFYSLVYDLPESELMDTVYMFDSEQHGISDDMIRDMMRAAEAWREAYRLGSTLTQHETPAGIIVEDRRSGWPRLDHLISEPAAVALYRALRKPQSLAALSQILEQSGYRAHAQELEDRLADFKEKGWVFEDDGTYIALATNNIPFRLRLAA